MVDNCDKAEIELKKTFNQSFRRAEEHGIEYYEGSLSKMIEYIVSYQYNPHIVTKCVKCNISIMQNSSYFKFCCNYYHKHCIDQIVVREGLKCIECCEIYNMEKAYYAGKIYKSAENNSNIGGYPRIWKKRSCKIDLSEETSEEIEEKSILSKSTQDKLSGFMRPKNKSNSRKITPVYTTHIELIGPTVPYCNIEGCLNCKFGHGIPYEYSYDVINSCEEQIKSSDVVVAVINKEQDCYATIMEIGIAIANNKPTYILFENKDESYEEFWFIAKRCLMSLENGEQKYRHIRCYTLFNNIPVTPTLNEFNSWTDWSFLSFKSEEDYIEHVSFMINKFD